MKGMLFTTAALALMACQSSASRDSLTYRVVTSGSQAQTHSQAAVARTAAEYESLWRTLVGNAPMPPVDFATESAVILTSPPRPTGGYAIEVREITRGSGGALVVDAVVTDPPDGAMTIQVITTPFVVVAIPKTDATSVEWIR